MHTRAQLLAEQTDYRLASHHRPTGDAGSMSAGTASVPEILTGAADASKALLSQELQLARTEIAGKAKLAGKGAGLFGAAGITALFALGALTAAAILALALIVPAWLAAVIVGGLYAALAGVLALAGRSSVQEATPLVPEQTVRTLKLLPRKLRNAWQRSQA